MSTAIRRRRGTDSNHNSFTGADGEITVNTTNKSLHVHDGTTQRGQELLRNDFDNVDSSATLESAVTIPSTKTLTFGDNATITQPLDDLTVTASSNGGALKFYGQACQFYAGATTATRELRVSFGQYGNTFQEEKTTFKKDTGGTNNISNYAVSFINDSTTNYGWIATFNSQHQYYSPVVGAIGVTGASNNGFMYITNGRTTSNQSGLLFGAYQITPCTYNGGAYNNGVALGSSSAAFDDAYVVNGVTTGSDRNLKQNIEELSDKEMKVAQACKGLIRKYKLVSAVEEKGDDARTHVGIIAQDLEDAFTAEGLDASKYGMFCSDTYWSIEETVPEREEEYIDDNGELQTKTIAESVKNVIYDTESDAPEDATKVTTRSVRYTELLAFIIAAL